MKFLKTPPKPLAKIDEAIVRDVSLYIVENRLKNVLSKMERPTKKEFPKVAGLLLQDAIEDYEKDFGHSAKEIAQEYKRVHKQLMAACADLLKPVWLDILEGEY